MRYKSIKNCLPTRVHDCVGRPRSVYPKPLITHPKSKRGDKCNPINERQINNIGCFEEMSIDIEGKKLTGW